MNNQINRLHNWESFKIRDICKVGTGGTPSTKVISYYIPPEINWLKSGDIKGFYINEATHKISQEGLDNSAAKIFNKGAVMIALSGQGKTRATTAILNIDAACSQSVAAIIPSERILSEYLHLQLKSRYRELRNLTGDNDRSGLNLSLVGNIDVKVPPLEIQKKIVKVLIALNYAIEQQDKIIETTTNLKKSLMQKLFTEGLHGEPQKETEIGLMPESWKVSALKDVVSYIDYGLSEAIPKNPPKDGIKIVSTADINKSGVILYKQIRTISANENIVKKLSLEDGDVLFNWRNSLDHIGKSAIYKMQDQPHIFASFILRIKCDENNSHNRYLCYLMNYFREMGVFSKLARRAVNQANYNRNEIYVLKMPVPSYDEQKKIADIIDIADKNIKAHKVLKEKYTALFNSMLDQLMSGELKVDSIDV